jgi:hypothetical protein
MFADVRRLGWTKRQRSFVWASHADNLLVVAAVFAGSGLLFSPSLARCLADAKGIHGLVLGDLTAVVIAAFIGR